MAEPRARFRKARLLIPGPPANALRPVKSQKTGQFQGEVCGVNASNQ